MDKNTTKINDFSENDPHHVGRCFIQDDKPWTEEECARARAHTEELIEKANAWRKRPRNESKGWTLFDI